MKIRQILLLNILLMAGTAIGVIAQSQDRENPTPLAANTITGSGVGKKVEYYYSFTAGPGEIVVTIDLKAKAGSTNADVEIFDADSKVFFAKYGLAGIPRVSDPSRHIYHAFGLGRGGLLALFGPRVWWRGFYAGVLRGHGIGRLMGNGFQMPGVFLVRRGTIVRSFRHLSSSDRLDFVAFCRMPVTVEPGLHDNTA